MSRSSRSRRPHLRVACRVLVGEHRRPRTGLCRRRYVSVVYTRRYTRNIVVLAHGNQVPSSSRNFRVVSTMHPLLRLLPHDLLLLLRLLLLLLPLGIHLPVLHLPLLPHLHPRVGCRVPRVAVAILTSVECRIVLRLSMLRHAVSAVASQRTWASFACVGPASGATCGVGPWDGRIIAAGIPILPCAGARKGGMPRHCRGLRRHVSACAAFEVNSRAAITTTAVTTMTHRAIGVWGPNRLWRLQWLATTAMARAAACAGGRKGQRIVAVLWIWIMGVRLGDGWQHGIVRQLSSSPGFPQRPLVSQRTFRIEAFLGILGQCLAQKAPNAACHGVPRRPMKG
mmetsp:Transcript_88931/g.250465  ORF Transcript_88931/g.250465 Transcript_88931/m.250465 type:complete len:340 (-) Transcript_88931:9-1028(-)